MVQINQDKMYKLGLAMEEFRKFFWTGICLFFFLIPPFILLWKYIKFIMALNDVRLTSPENENLKYGFFGLVIGIALSSVFGAVGYIYLDMIYYIGGLQIICFILSWIKLEKWGEDLYREHATGKLAEFKEGMRDMKVAHILLIIIVGVFMIPEAFGKAGRALMKQYAPPQQPQYRQPQQPQYRQPQPPPTQSSKIPNICPQCGDQSSDKNIRYCARVDMNSKKFFFKVFLFFVLTKFSIFH